LGERLKDPFHPYRELSARFLKTRLIERPSYTTWLRAQKKSVARAVRQRMDDLDVGNAALAKQMDTSRPLIDQLLDPEN
jgi:hypothetical protein